MYADDSGFYVSGKNSCIVSEKLTSSLTNIHLAGRLLFDSKHKVHVLLHHNVHYQLCVSVNDNQIKFQKKITLDSNVSFKTKRVKWSDMSCFKLTILTFECD